MIKQKTVEILGKLVTGIILLFLGTLLWWWESSWDLQTVYCENLINAV